MMVNITNLVQTGSFTANLKLGSILELVDIWGSSELPYSGEFSSLQPNLEEEVQCICYTPSIVSRN